MDAKRSGGLDGQAPGAPLTKTLHFQAGRDTCFFLVLYKIVTFGQRMTLLVRAVLVIAYNAICCHSIWWLRGITFVYSNFQVVRPETWLFQKNTFLPRVASAKVVGSAIIC